MLNNIQDGNVKEVVLADVAESGGVVVIGDLVGVAVNPGVAGDTISVNLNGVYSLPKTTGAISNGSKVYVTSVGLNITTTATGNKAIGYAWNDAASADSTINVLLARI